jgi:hypothetical protein
MAGDWIKMRINLDTDPRVIEMASVLETTELHVVGCLWKVWSWADSHTLDGNAIRVTDVTLDRFTGVTGFAVALRKVGWLEGRDGALTFPRFSEHNGQTAKKRAETKERVAKHRSGKAEECNANCVTSVTQKVLPEKRREEKNTLSKDRVGKTPARPTLEEVKAYAAERKSTIDVEQFFDHYQANGWRQGNGNAIKDWQAAVRQWERREGEFKRTGEAPPGPRKKDPKVEWENKRSMLVKRSRAEGWSEDELRRRIEAIPKPELATA